jgi:hypothetical protein
MDVRKGRFEGKLLVGVVLHEVCIEVNATSFMVRLAYLIHAYDS